MLDLKHPFKFSEAALIKLLHCKKSHRLLESAIIYKINHIKQWLIGLVGRVFANGPGNLGSIPGHVIPKTLKMVLNTSLLNTQQYTVLSKVKWSNLGKGVAPSPTPQCSSY